MPSVSHNASVIPTPGDPLSVIASFTKALGKVLGTSTKKAAPAQPNAAPPTMANTSVEADAAAEDELKRRAAGGKSSTYLTGGSGLASTGTVSTSGLLGS